MGAVTMGTHAPLLPSPQKDFISNFFCIIHPKRKSELAYLLLFAAKTHETITGTSKIQETEKNIPDQYYKNSLPKKQVAAVFKVKMPQVFITSDSVIFC